MLEFMTMYHLVVIGAGAAGIFAALRAKAQNPSARVAVLEKSATALAKVRVSGGGRCNVTHACFDPLALAKHYPRGEKELISLFHHFQPSDTIEWFESRGVKLKTEADGRIFPVTDRSETIITCLLGEAQKLGIEIFFCERVQTITKQDKGFLIESKGRSVHAACLILATGSSPEGYTWAERLGHTIQKPVPSLFTLNAPASSLLHLSGISIPGAKLTIQGTDFHQRGPLLLTHFGFSGPAALKLSAWGARYLHAKEYHVPLIIQWLPELRQEEILSTFQHLKHASPQTNLFTENPFTLPKNLWKALLTERLCRRLGDISRHDLQSLACKLHHDLYHVEGKTTNKEEFVTCGGIALKEVNFKTMESKICPGLFFVGEVLDIDGITGGFNFQNAWTTGYIAGSCVKKE